MLESRDEQTRTLSSSVVAIKIEGLREQSYLLPVNNSLTTDCDCCSTAISDRFSAGSKDGLRSSNP